MTYSPGTNEERMKNILITGGAGFIGSHLVDLLLDEGQWHVSVVDDFNDFYDPATKRANVKRRHDNPNERSCEADISDQPALAKILAERSLSAIVHLAARAGVRPSRAQPLLYNDKNITGTMTLLE